MGEMQMIYSESEGWETAVSYIWLWGWDGRK